VNVGNADDKKWSINGRLSGNRTSALRYRSASVEQDWRRTSALLKVEVCIG
jgi:hypothetical protein